MHIEIFDSVHKDAKRKISILEEPGYGNVVFIQNIAFKGKRKINWKDVENYLRDYIGNFYEIHQTGDTIYISKDFPDEYTNSKDTQRLKGALAKAKANAAQGIPELIQAASNQSFKKNLAEKHKKDAKFGWYRYDSHVALPVWGENGTIDKYNIFHVRILIRHADDGKKYLYDIVNIKKETSTPPRQSSYGRKPISCN
ncbi:MAG: hypothetical protein Q4F41_06515 [Eubacteriales bacterium]|nr:hypothetical protein [Eubacteriales bacterium]